MYCRNCGEFMNDNQAICLKCGVKTGVGERYCANCGNELPSGADVCLKCGVAVKKGSSSGGGNIPEDEKVKYALISFFLGGLGVHNFMLGETKKGVTKLVADLFCGLGGILALIDFIRILTGSYEVDPSKMF